MTKKDPPANRTHLINHIAAQIDLDAHNLEVTDVGEMVDLVLQGIVELSTHAPYLQIREFGRFQMRERKARLQTKPILGGPPQQISARKVLWFTASPGMAVPV